MGLFEFVLLLNQDRGCGSRSAGINCLRSKTGATFATIKSNADQFHQTIVIDVSSRCYYEIAVGKLAGMKPDGRFVIEGRHCFARAFNWAAERLIWEVGRVEEFAEELVGRVLDHFHLFEDNLLLTFQVFLLKTR